MNTPKNINFSPMLQAIEIVNTLKENKFFEKREDLLLRLIFEELEKSYQNGIIQTSNIKHQTLNKVLSYNVYKMHNDALLEDWMKKVVKAFPNSISR